MSQFDDREKGFERKFAHDEEMQFKIHARSTKLLGLWAAEKLGKSGADAETYAKNLVIIDFDAPGDDDVVGALLKDFAAASLSITPLDIRSERERLTPVAREQIMSAKPQ